MITLIWEDVRQRTTDIGAALNRAFHAIEDANLRLKGIFQDVDFNYKARFPDTVLEGLLQHFDDARIARGDTLRDPKHLTPSNTLRRFDRVLANPPFSLKE